MLAGLIAGLIGAVLSVLGEWALLSVTGPLWQDQVRSQIESNPDIPPNVRDFIMRFLTGGGLAAVRFLVTVPTYAVFSTLGALLGLAFFRKKLPPAAPAPPAQTGAAV